VGISRKRGGEEGDFRGGDGDHHSYATSYASKFPAYHERVQAEYGEGNSVKSAGTGVVQRNFIPQQIAYLIKKTEASGQEKLSKKGGRRKKRGGKKDRMLKRLFRVCSIFTVRFEDSEKKSQTRRFPNVKEPNGHYRNETTRHGRESRDGGRPRSEGDQFDLDSSKWKLPTFRHTKVRTKPNPMRRVSGYESG